MIEVSRHWRSWLAAPAAAAVTVLGITIPAQAKPSPPTRAAAPSAPTMRSLRSLDHERAPAGGRRWVVSDPVAYRQAMKTGNWVQTPYGLASKTCVFHAADHAVVRNREIVSPSGATQRMTPCAHPTLVDPGSVKPGTLGHSTGGSAIEKIATAAGPCGFASGGNYWAASCYGSAPEWATSMDQLYAVPTNPAQDGALIFLWDGLANASGNTLLQDVLTWGANGSIVTNPNIWYVTPWYLAPGNDIVNGASIHVGAGDTIVANLTASNCNSTGQCTWLEQSTDKNNGKSTSYTVASDATFDLLLGAVMEVPRDNGCIQTPANGHAAFRQLTVTGNDGAITPDFGTSTPDPQCNISIRQADNGADILWTP